MNRRKREILQKYQQGERNFQGANLSGLSFEEEDLSDTDFSFADIRSSNFYGANLTRAKFCGAEAGLHAIKAAGVAAVEQLLNHPASSFVIAALEDLQKTK